VCERELSQLILTFVACCQLFTLHGLRHFYTTKILKMGTKLEVVGGILGHSGIGATVDIYPPLIRLCLYVARA